MKIIVIEAKLITLWPTFKIYLFVKEILKALIQNNFYQILGKFQEKYLWRNVTLLMILKLMIL